MIVSYLFSIYNCRYEAWKGANMANKIRTSKRVGKMASKSLRSKNTSKSTKSIAGSALRNRAK